MPLEVKFNGDKGKIVIHRNSLFHLKIEHDDQK